MSWTISKNENLCRAVGHGVRRSTGRFFNQKIILILVTAAVILGTVLDPVSARQISPPTIAAEKSNATASLLRRFPIQQSSLMKEDKKVTKQQKTNSQAVTAYSYDLYADSYFENIANVFFEFSSYPYSVTFSMSPICGSLNPTYVQSPIAPPYSFVTTYTPCEAEDSVVTIKADPAASVLPNLYATVYLKPRIDIESGEQYEMCVATYDADTGLPDESYVQVTVIPTEAGTVYPSSGLSEYDPFYGEYIFCSTYTAGSYDGRVRVKFRIDNPYPYDDSILIYSFDQTPPFLTVISPNGGESWLRWTSHNIIWNPGGSSCSYVKIELDEGDSSPRLIALSTQNDGIYNWTVSAPAGDEKYKVKIICKSDTSIWDESDNTFSITEPPSITVTSPNGGERWQQGTTHNITWSSSGSPGSYVKIELYKDGSYDSTITSSTYNDGLHPWPIPSDQAVGEDYKVKITSTSNSSYYDYSNNYFSITEPPPDAPTGVSASDGTYTDKIQVSWNASSGATSYEIWRYTSNNSGSASKIADDDTASPYDDTNAVAGTTYWYWVKAKNSGGTSGFSNCDSGYLLTTLDAPVLNAEPNITPGLRNTIWWDPAPNANWYYAEFAEDMNFTNIDANSGWITDTSYEFCGLEHGQTYWYRVKAWAPFLLKTWLQTSQQDFETDTLTDTTTTSVGNVVLAGGGGAPTVDTVGDTSLDISTTYGYMNCCFVTTGTTLTQIEVYLGISTSRTIEFVVYEGGALFSDQYNRIHSSTLASSGTGTKFYTSEPISVPLEAGKYYMIGAVWSSSVSMYYSSGHSSSSFGSHVGYGYYDGFPSPDTLINTSSSDYTMYHRYTTVQGTGYTTPGSIVSTAIDLPADGSWAWDVVDFNTTTPANTELTVDVLNGSDESVILADVASGTDINEITATSLKLRANLSTTDANNTPVLHDWSVSYTDPVFACESGWSNVESSLQCDTLCDFDNNNEINFGDFAILAGQWWQTPDSPSADIAPEVPDGFVDYLDLAVFVENWLLDLTCTVEN